MDYYLENESMGMLEKNKALFASIGSTFQNPMVDPSEEHEHQIDTFKMYSSFLKEKDGLLKIIDEICKYSVDPNTKETKTITSLQSLIEYKNRTIMILTSYQEQPGLLDPILPIIIPQMTSTSLKLIEIALKDDSNKNNFEFITCIYQIIYIICKVRGFSPIAKFFSSEVSIFENVILFLVKQPYENVNSWYVNYVLVLWTSILAMVPFDIDTIDTQGELINKLIEYLKQELTRSTNLRIITAYAISKFLTRPDLIKKKHLENYFNYCTSVLFDKEQNYDIFKVLGIVLSLCEIFKNGLPKDLISFVDPVINKILTFNYPEKAILNSGVFRKTMTKLIQRVGLVLLKPRPQTWRYHMNVKKMLDKTNNEDKNESKITSTEEEEALDYELDFSLLETIIDYLMQKLTDKEYIVRWSAAKGLGRICERLTKAMVEEIFHNLFDLFKEDENEFAWHGACLCIAELCKRGMILPERLAELIPFLERALIYETSKGSFCTGSNVRDSACYIVWALARAFTTDIMKKYVDRLASTLILTILFDKEVNCRRAASAAFQENVGRQGNFPHGIEILTEADYFTLGLRTNCYLNISIFIAQYDAYFKSIVDYLAFNRLIHIERAIRELASEALALLVPFKPEYFIDEILPKLLKNSQSLNIHCRHGCLIGIGHILLGLNGKWDFYHKASINRKKMLGGLSSKEKKIMEDSENRKKFDEKYDAIKTINHIELLLNKKELTSNIIGIISKLDEAKLYRGKGNEVMREGVNYFIRLISEVKLPITVNDYVYYHEILIDNIRQIKNVIQEQACDTLRILNSSYGDVFNQDEAVSTKLEKIFKEMLTQCVTDDNIHVTNGYTRAIVNFNDGFIIKYYSNVMESLIKNAKMKTTNNNDPLTRKSAIESIGFITVKHLKDLQNDIYKKIETIFDGFEDYEMDPRIGDVGSNVRMACIKTIINIMIALYKMKTPETKELFKKYIVTVLQKVIKQLAEKMASVRKIAGNEMQKFFYEMKDNDEELEKIIPHYRELKNMFLTDIDFDENDNVYNMKWVEPEFAYVKIMPLATYETYSNYFIEGLIRSIACISEDVQKCSLDELKKLMEKDNDTKTQLIKKILSVSLEIFTKKAKDDRFIEPLECSLGILLSLNMFINNDYLSFVDKIHKSVMKENIESKNIHKILYSVDIFYNMLFYEKEDNFKVMYRSLRSLLILMCHRYPVVRKKASEKLFIFLSSLDDPSQIGIDDEKLEEANLLVADTDWTQKVATIRDNRNNIAKFLNITI